MMSWRRHSRPLSPFCLKSSPEWHHIICTLSKVQHGQKIKKDFNPFYSIIINTTVCQHQTFHSPELCAASAAILHRLTALIQVDSKRLHSWSLSLICQDKEMRQSQYNECISLYCFLQRVKADFNRKNQRLEYIKVCFQQHKLTSARWPLITSRNESSSAGVSFPTEAKYRLWTAMRVCTAC